MIDINHSKTRYLAITLIFIKVVTSLIVDKTGTYYYVLQHFRAVAEHNSTIPVRSTFECAKICNNDESCVIANYGTRDGHKYVCELMSMQSHVSDLSTEISTEGQTLGK